MKIRITSLNATNILKRIRRRNQKAWKYFSKRIYFSFLIPKSPRMAQIVIVSHLPPSSAGNGRRLKNPRLRDRRAATTKMMEVATFASTIFTNRFPSPIGHDMLFTASVLSVGVRGANIFCPSPRNISTVITKCSLNSSLPITTASEKLFARISWSCMSAYQT